MGFLSRIISQFVLKNISIIFRIVFKHISNVFLKSFSIVFEFILPKRAGCQPLRERMFALKDVLVASHEENACPL